MTCAPSSGREPQPAGQVRVEDVEAAGAELEQAGLLVHEHVVADLDRAGQTRVGDAGDPVDLEPDQPLARLEHGRDDPASKPERHRRRAQRHVDHRVEVGDRDVLVGGVDLGHPVREVRRTESRAG